MSIEVLEVEEEVEINHSDVDRQILHYQALREDVRTEIKTRIQQRDNFSTQFITALGAIVAVAFAKDGFEKVILIAPLIVIYYTMQIMYSYRVHDILARYLREEIEPTLTRLCKGNPEHEWERYYKKNAKPGIRRKFFIYVMWMVSVGILAYYMNVTSIKNTTAFAAGIIYLAAMIWVTFTFKRDIK
jgi:hypothetical protein